MNWFLTRYLKYFSNIKLKGSLIQMTLVVSLIITMSLSMFILYRYYLKQFFANYHSLVQLQENINSATLLLESEINSGEEEQRIIDIGNKSKVNCQIQPWGFYSVATLTTQIQIRKRQSIRLFGNNIFRQDLLPSIYYSPKKKYLSVGGNTFLAGDLYLPENGIQKATLEGKSYSRKEAHYGNVLRATEKLPRIHNNNVQLINNMLNYNFLFTDINEESTYLPIKTNSFLKPAVLLRYSDQETIQNIKFSGKVIIDGGDRLELDSTCNIDNCIVVAKSILLKEGFKGRGQFFAQNSFNIEKHVRIENPSVLCLWNPGVPASMSIADSSYFYSDIIVNAKASNKKPVLSVGNSNLCGQVYCDGMLQFQGTLFGSLYANFIVFLDHYFPVENYLYNSCIDVTRIPKEYVGISFFDPFLNRRYADTVY